MRNRVMAPRVTTTLVGALILAMSGCGGASVDRAAWRASFAGQTEKSLGGFENRAAVGADVAVTDAQIDKMVSEYCKMQASGSNMAGLLMWERASGASTFFSRDKVVAVASAFAATSSTAKC